MNDRLGIYYNMAKPGFVRLDVFDAGGRRVRRLAWEEKRKGKGHTHWDGRDDDGRKTASGVYFLKARLGTEQVMKKLIVLK